MKVATLESYIDQKIGQCDVQYQTNLYVIPQADATVASVTLGGRRARNESLAIESMPPVQWFRTTTAETA